MYSELLSELMFGVQEALLNKVPTKWDSCQGLVKPYCGSVLPNKRLYEDTVRFYFFPKCEAKLRFFRE